MGTQFNGLILWTVMTSLLMNSLTVVRADQANSLVPATDDGQALDGADEQEYYDLFRLFADTIDQIERNYVKELDRRELIEAAIRGLTSELDPYSNYIPPDEFERFQTNIDSEFGGIGIQISMDRGQITIISPLVGTPAYRGGLMAGDRIVEIEGESTDGISLDEAVRRMKGKIGTDVTVTVRHPNNDENRTVTLTRETIRIDTVLGDHRNADDRWEFMYDSDEKIGYIRLTAFSRNSARDLRRTMEELQATGLRGLVFDLRFNPGGLLSSAVEVSDMFISNGVIVSTEGRNTQKKEWKAHQAGTFQGFPMAVLINGFSASASEIVAACLQDHGRAVVVGERSWGKGSVQNVVELEDGKSALKLTTASYQRPSGENIHRFYGANKNDDWGVKPDEDYEVEFTSKEMTAYLNYRRERDIIAAKEVDTVSESKTPSETEETPQERDPADSSEEGDENNVVPSDIPDESQPNQVPNDANNEESPGENSAEGDSSDPNNDKAFKDVQLEKALEYLRKNMSELVRN